MSSDLLKELSGSEEFQQSLELIREDRQDYETFFEDVFKRLEETLTEAVQEQLTWEQQRTRKETALAEQSAEIERQSREFEIQREKFLAESIAAVQEQFQLQSQSQSQQISELDLSAVGELESRLKATLEGAEQERQALQDALASTGSQAEQLTSVAETMAAAQEQFQQQAQANSQADLSAICELESSLKATLEEAGRERETLQDALASTGSQAERLTSVAETMAAAQEQFQQQAQASSQANPLDIDELESRLKATLEEALSSTDSQAEQLTSAIEALTASQEKSQQQTKKDSEAGLSAMSELESRLKATLEEAGREREALQDVLSSTSSQAERLASVADTLTAAQDLFQRQAVESGQADILAVGELESRLNATLEEAGRERQALQDALASTVSQADRLTSVAEALTAAQDLFQRQAVESGQADISAVGELESRLNATLEEAGHERQALQDALASTVSQADRLTSVAEALTAAQEQFQQQASQAEELTSVAKALATAQEQFQCQAQTSGQADLSAVGELESRLQATLEEAGRERESLQDALASTSSQADRLTSVAEALTAAQEKLQRQIEERDEAANSITAQGAPDEVLARMQHLEEERAEMLQGRSLLEAELESVRQRAVDLMTALEYQKSTASEQQNQLNDELKRQRQLLEQVLGRLAELEISPPASAATNMPASIAGTPSTGPPPAETDSVLSSVMSQFEVLQKDIARRRNKPSK